MADSPQTTQPRTYSDVMIDALTMYWFGGQPETALQIIGVLLDWRDDCALLATAGGDGAL